MKLGRLLRHLATSHWKLRRLFPQHSLSAIEGAIRDAERAHGGEIRFAVEAAVDVAPLLARHSARQRAIEVFSHLRVWDTEHNNGVLIYVLLADRDVEIVADRGVNARVDASQWEAICRDMERAYRDGRFEEGAIAGVRAVASLLRRHYPSEGPDVNELPDRPVVL